MLILSGFQITKKKFNKGSVANRVLSLLFSNTTACVTCTKQEKHKLSISELLPSKAHMVMISVLGGDIRIIQQKDQIFQMKKKT
jgi:hypothetical protein